MERENKQILKEKRLVSIDKKIDNIGKEVNKINTKLDKIIDFLQRKEDNRGFLVGSYKTEFSNT